MARRQGRVNLEALGIRITDAIMRALVPDIERRVVEVSAAAVARGLGPALDQLSALERRVGILDSQQNASVELLDSRTRSTINACEGLCDRAVERVLAEVRALQYCGVYEVTLAYERNNAVTHRGSLWIARQAAAAGVAPGSDAGAEVWTLAVKCGRDARGA